MPTLSFFATHYAALAVFAVACWGLGRALLARFVAPARGDAGLETALAAGAGLGMVVVLFQLLAIARALSAGTVLAVVGLGLVSAAMHLPGAIRRIRACEPSPHFANRLEKIALALLLMLALPTLIAPLAPPAAYDELMYHLPYAREVARTGSLVVAEWLRYPWFPYNFNLVYAGALLVGDDVLPHLMSAFAGWLSVWMVYRLGLRHAGRITGCIAAVTWMLVGDYASALIDTSVALFVLSACIALWWWHEQAPARDARWLALAAFLLGVAAGSKYQALTVTPLVALFVIRREQRLRVLLPVLLCFLVPCVYWYARNAILTGDPFNPIGARLFGFTNWNAGDYKRQLDDVQAHASWPNAVLWGLVLVPFCRAWKQSAALRAAAVFSAYSLFVWALTSRYPRYLTASVPLLALVAVVGWQGLLGGLLGLLRRWMPRMDRNGSFELIGRSLAVLVVVTAVFATLQLGRQRLAGVAVTTAQRQAFLEGHVPGYAVMDYLREHAKGRTYQIALSEAIYYGPSPVWGDTLGPWRYVDFLLLPPAEFARKLGGLGFEALAVSADTVPVLEAKPGFLDHFQPVFAKDGAKAYRILPHE